MQEVDNKGDLPEAHGEQGWEDPKDPRTGADEVIPPLAERLNTEGKADAEGNTQEDYCRTAS